MKVEENPEQWCIISERGFSTDLENVLKLLDNIFHIIDEINPRGNPDYYRNDLLTFSKLWLNGKFFREIINRALPSKIRNSANLKSDEVDKAMKKAMAFITKDISFVTAKYFQFLLISSILLWMKINSMIFQ